MRLAAQLEEQCSLKLGEPCTVPVDLMPPVDVMIPICNMPNLRQDKSKLGCLSLISTIQSPAPVVLSHR